MASMNTRALASHRSAFKEQMLAAREEAIIQQVNHLLAEKGFDAMTVDEVAAGVGIAKASLYKHFTSKEELAAAAMVRVLRRARQFLASLPDSQPPIERLRAVVRWSLELQLDGQMPFLPSQNSALRATLLGTREYGDSLRDIGARVGSWIEAAQADGSLNPALPRVAVLCTLYARSCDPVLEFLKAAGQHSREQIVELVLTTCFEGLNRR
jgi:TetR/AcrR family transcriptional regulator, regulator of autoinduction and epiphytic fitness